MTATVGGSNRLTQVFNTVDAERLYQYSLSLSRSTRTVTTQNSKILALSAGVITTYEQLTPQIS